MKIKTYNGIHIPYHMRLTGTEFEEIPHTGRADLQWGNIIVNHPEDVEHHLQREEERENDE